MPAVRAETYSWAPPPVNSCGEIGFDPLRRTPEPSASPSADPVPPPPQLDIPLRIPDVIPVPVPDPPQLDTRIEPQPLPADPCRNPCPDIRDTPGRDAPAPPLPPAPDPGSGTGSFSGSSLDSGSGSGSSVPDRIEWPGVRIRPELEPFPIPVPGGPGDPPQPAPPEVVHPAEPGPVSEPVPVPRVGSVGLVGQVTGHGSQNRTDMRWQVDGTDLGIVWETRPGEVAVVFGDTFGEGWEAGAVGGPDWRSNVLGYSTGRDLSKGLIIDNMVQDSRCHAAEVLSSRKITNWATTAIPTSGFALGSRQYLSFMSVNRWHETPGKWSTNYGGLAYSDDNGSTWTKSQHAKWDNIFGENRFQVTAMAPQGDYVYMFGTPNGRFGQIGLARVPKDEVLNKSAYQYWASETWAPAAENQATPIASGMAGELSVRFDETTGQWQMMYLDPARASIVLRTSATPQGAWTDPVALVEAEDYPSLYGGFIHPWSTATDLYFTLSAWDTYNVYLMHAELKPAR
ncbi:DUF4185 domain-containing protein [Nocardia brasiliensis]|uniref:DUF4185 domain-containing protein n=1 Tax=Nocardia brasiliensis TaxID=37326 RepID=UPI0024574F0A|nr:DUF4185 domain-containing protein [Nocardia brasiliensis]